MFKDGAHGHLMDDNELLMNKGALKHISGKNGNMAS